MIGFWCAIYCIVEATERLFFSRNENVRKNGIANVNAGEITPEIIASKRGSRVLSRRLFRQKHQHTKTSFQSFRQQLNLTTNLFPRPAVPNPLANASLN